MNTTKLARTSKRLLTAHRSTSPQVSLHSFVLGFFIGCAVIYVFGIYYNNICIGTICGSLSSEPKRTQYPIVDDLNTHVYDTLPTTLANKDKNVNRVGDSENMDTSPSKRQSIRETVHEDKGASISVSICEDRLLHVVILVLTSPRGALRRNAIRGSWLHSFDTKKIKVTSKFLVGTLGLEQSKGHDLQLESKQFNDMLLFSDLKDSYHNLSRKVLFGLNWAEQELGYFDFLIKADDDSFIQIEKVAENFKELGCPDSLYWGYFMGHAYPEPTGKWAEKNWFSCPHYLPYAMGGGYVLSKRIVDIIVRLSDRLLLYSNEDVTVGSWLAPFNLLRRHDMRFNVESMTHGCNNKYLITHKDTARNMYQKFKNLKANGTLCSPEKEIRPGYNYDWSVSPLDCCNRTKGLDIQFSLFDV